MYDEAIEKDLLINQRRKAHTCWATFFFVFTIVLGISSLLPGVQFAEALMLIVYPGFGPVNAEWFSSLLTGVCAFLCCVSFFFACRDTPALHKLQSTDNIEDAYRASLVGLGLRRDTGSSAGSPRPMSRVSTATAKTSRTDLGQQKSSTPSANERQRNIQNTPGSSGRRRSGSRGRGSSSRGGRAASSHGGAGGASFQSPISRLLSGFDGVRQWSTDRAREVASMSPVGRGLDVDLLDRRTGIDSPQMLARYMSSFQQQREVQQQRSGFRNVLDPNAQAGRQNRPPLTYRSGQRRRSTPSSLTTSTLLSDDQLAEGNAKAEKQYEHMGINDFIANWQANFRQVFAEILQRNFLRQLDRNNQDLEAKGVEMNLLQHTSLTQTDFSTMRDKLKEQATKLYTERDNLIRHPSYQTVSTQNSERQAAHASNLHDRLLDRLDSNFKDFNNLDMRQLLYRCSIQVKAHDRHREEETHGIGGSRSSSSSSRSNSARGIPMMGMGGVGLGGGATGGGGGGGLVPGGGGVGGMMGGNALVPTQTPGMMMNSSGVMVPNTDLFQSTTVTGDYERLFYCYFLSGSENGDSMPRRDPRNPSRLVNLIEERERLEKYLLVPSMPEQSRGYVLKRIREFIKDRRFGEMNWKGGGVYKNVPWTRESRTLKLPSDVQIILHLFFTHIELYLRVKGFTAKYKVSGEELEQRHSVGPDLCVVERRTVKYTSHVQVIYKGKELAVRYGRDNVFEALTLFLYFCNEMYDGNLEGVDLHRELCLDEVFDDSGLMMM